MKQLLIHLLAMLGLVPARRYRFQADQLRAAESRTKELTKRIEGLERSVSAWQTKANDALKQVKVKEEEGARHLQRLDKFKLEIDKARQRSANVEAIQKRLVDAQRELSAAREHLMAVEVKLDILEGAANVLDLRTRTAIARQPGEGGAPV